MNAHTPPDTPPEIAASLGQARDARDYLEDMLRFGDRGDWTGVKRSHLMAQSYMARLNIGFPAADAAARRVLGTSDGDERLPQSDADEPNKGGAE